MEHRADLTSMVETACRFVAARPFLIDDRVALSGAETARAIRQAAARLVAAGLRPGTSAAFIAGASVDQAVAFFAVERVGGVACCLHVRETDARLAEMLKDLAPQIVIADADEAARAARAVAAAGLAAPVLALEEVARLAADAAEAPAHPAAPDDLAAIILSSGTTGRPKKVMHTQRSLRATAMMGGPIYGALGPGDSVLVPMAPSFAAWIHTVLPLFAQRCRLVFQRRFDPAAYADILAQERISIAALVPTLWRMVLPVLAERDVPALRVAMFSGEPGTPELVDALCRRLPVVRSVYLASEGGCGAGIVAGEDVLARPGMAGVAGAPVPGGDAMIIDPDAGELRALPAGEVGEIALGGPSLSCGYQGDPALTAARFMNGWWRSGDHGRIDADGLLHVSGRLDNRINSGGIKVHAEEVEADILRLAMVRAAAVIGVPDPMWGERIEAHVTLAAAGATPAELAAAFEAATTLPRAMRPKHFHIHAALPTGPTGKLYRRGLRDAAPPDGHGT